MSWDWFYITSCRKPFPNKKIRWCHFFPSSTVIKFTAKFDSESRKSSTRLILPVFARQSGIFKKFRRAYLCLPSYQDSGWPSHWPRWWRRWKCPLRRGPSSLRGNWDQIRDNYIVRFNLNVKNQGHLFESEGHLFEIQGHLFDREGHLFDRKGHLFLEGLQFCNKVLVGRNFDHVFEPYPLKSGDR